VRGWQALDPAGLDALVRTAAAQGAAVTPSLLRWGQLLRDGDPRFEHTPFVPLLPRFYPAVIWPGEIIDSSEPAAAAEVDRGEQWRSPASGQAVAAMQEAVRRLNDAGIPIYVGTGTPSPYVVPGMSVYLEMGYLVASGLTPEAAWVAATRAPAESLGIPKLGTLEAGAPADLLIFRDDPTRDLDAFNSLQAVVSQGRLYPKPALVRYVMDYVRYVHGGAYDHLSTLLARLATWWEGGAGNGCESR
jgi:hypothetical protein